MISPSPRPENQTYNSPAYNPIFIEYNIYKTEINNHIVIPSEDIDRDGFIDNTFSSRKGYILAEK